MDMRDALNVELQTLDIFYEVRRVRTWSRQRRRAGTRRKQIGLNDQLLFWHVRHQHSLGVQIPANQVQLEVILPSVRTRLSFIVSIMTARGIFAKRSGFS